MILKVVSQSTFKDECKRSERIVCPFQFRTPAATGTTAVASEIGIHKN
jgi:hypothetical protein